MDHQPTNSGRGSTGMCRARTFIIAVLLLLCGLRAEAAVTPPIIRSTGYNGAYSNIVYFPLRPWMNTNTVNLTVEAWIRAGDLIGNQAIVARSFTTNLYFGLSGNRLRLYRSGGTFVDSSGTVVAQRWTHVAATYDGTTARFYIDGVAAGASALASRGNDCTNSLSLGGQRDNAILANGYAFNGSLDEVRLWSVARSQSQIASSMNQELRSGAGLLATFGKGGWNNDLTGQTGGTGGIPIHDRESGFGILPADLCVPWTGNALRVDANIDLFNEYRGAETIVLRSTTSSTAPDYPAYLMVSTNSTNFHLYVGIPALPQGGTGANAPVVQLMADVNVGDGTNVALGDWECRLDQDGFQGGNIFGVNPPFFPTPQWLSWGQSTSNWQAATAEPFEFNQNYEFRVHGRHLNNFSNSVGLLVRYFDYVSVIGQWSAPRGGIVNLPATFARVNWCGPADNNLSVVTLSGTVTNFSTGTGVAGSNVRLFSGDSELTGFLLEQTTTDAQGRFFFNSVSVPSERTLTVTYDPPGGVVQMPPVIDSSSPAGQPVAINSPSSVRYRACASSCGYAKVNFRHRTLGPLLISGVTPNPVPAAVVLRTSPLKLTPTSTIIVSGSNFHPGLELYFKGAGCSLIPPSFCDRDFEQATILSFSPDGLSLEAQVPTTLENVTTTSRSFQIVMKNTATGPLWNYGPSVTVTSPTYPQLYGFEFQNTDDCPSWEEFEACFGDNIFVDVPFTDVAIPGLRDPYYMAFYLPIYLEWMEIARGSCSGFAATSRLMANGIIPSNAYDRPDNGDGVHGVVFPAGYVAPIGDAPPRPARWTGFDPIRPFQPINVWGRITSLQGAQTSAEFLNNWLGQLHRPISIGPRRGLSVGDPMQVLNRVRSNPGAQIIVLGGRDFQALHSVTPYSVMEEFGLAADVLTPEPRAGFTLIKIYDSNRIDAERYIEVDRGQNTFRYRFSSSIVCEGAGLYHIPLSVFSGGRHALGMFDIAANLTSLLRVLHTGTTTASLRDSTGGTAGWSGTNFFNSYADAMPLIPPGALPDQPDRFDHTLLLLPTTNLPVAANFVSAGSNVVLHYALGGGDFAVGFRAPNTTVSNSVYGILISSNQALQGMGVRAGAAVQGFSAGVASRDLSRRSLIWQIDAGSGTMTPDVHLERDEFTSLKIRNNSAQPFTYRVNVAGYDPQGGQGVFEFSGDSTTQPGNSTVVLRQLPGTPRGLARELDTNNDGTPETIEALPARGALRATKEAGLLALRWRPLTSGDTLVCSSNVAGTAWSPVNATVSTEGADRLARLPLAGTRQFYRVIPAASNCLSLAAQPLGAKPNPWTVGGLKFEAYNATGAAQPQNTILTRSGATGIDVAHTLRIYPQEDCDTMHLDVRQTSGYVIVEAIGPLGAIVGRQELIGPGAGLQRVTVRGFRSLIQYVRVISPNALCLVANICCERTPPPNSPPAYSNCQSLSNATPGQFSSPYPLGEMRVSVTPGPVTIGPVSGLGGNWLKLSGQVELELLPPSAPCDRVRMRIRDLEGGIIIKAIDAAGNEVAHAGPLSGNAAPQEMVLSGTGITRVVVSSSSDKAFLQSICSERAAGP